MNRDLMPLFLVGLLLFAGCAGGQGGLGETPARPEPTVTPKPIPEFPEQIDRDTAGSFAVRFEEAYGYNGAITEDTTELSVSPKIRSLNETDDGYLIRLRVSIASEATSYEEGEWQQGEGHGAYAVRYFINDTIVVRSNTVPPATGIPDPRKLTRSRTVLSQSPDNTETTDESDERRIARGESDDVVHGQYRSDSHLSAPEVRCVKIARDAVLEHLRGRLDDTESIAFGAGRGHPERDDLVVTVRHITEYDRDGELIREPTVEFDRLLAVTPRTARATLVLPNDDCECEVPVYVIEQGARLD